MKIRTKTSPTHNLTIGDEYYHNSCFEYNIVNANQTREQVLKDVVTIVDSYGQNI